MNRLYRNQFLIRRNLVAMIGICLCLYFFYHAIQGERSYMQLLSLNNTIEETKIKIVDLKNERQALEKKIVMMRPTTFDRDLLEERVRTVLGYKHPDELAIIDHSS